MGGERHGQIVPKVDEWIWGNEVLIWGFSPDHKYTCKVLQPKVGRPGMLSLQYHHEKSESWIQIQGMAWALLIVDGVVCTRILRHGDIQNIEVGTIHRLMGLTEDCKVLEPSTPDAHAADKSKTKDVVRLHCVLGRDVIVPKDEKQRALIEEAIAVSEDAIRAVEAGELPKELNVSVLLGKTGYHLPLS